jgi:hypothetical protein
VDKATLSDILREVSHAPQLHDHLARVVYGLGGGRMPFVVTGALSNLVTSGETVICTTPSLNPGNDSPFILCIGGWDTNAIGTTGSFALTQVKRGPFPSGANIGATNRTTVIAGNAYSTVLVGFDTPGAVAGQTYVMTGTITAATVNTVVDSGILIAISFG